MQVVVLTVIFGTNFDTCIPQHKKIWYNPIEWKVTTRTKILIITFLDSKVSHLSLSCLPNWFNPTASVCLRLQTISSSTRPTYPIWQLYASITLSQPCKLVTTAATFIINGHINMTLQLCSIKYMCFRIYPFILISPFLSSAQLSKKLPISDSCNKF